MASPERAYAARLAQLVAGQRIAMAREMREQTQRELAAAAGITPGALSQLETSHTKPSPDTLLAIALATNCPLDFFLRRPGPESPEGFFRSLRSTKARDRKAFLARAQLFYEFLEALEEYVRLPEPQLPDIDVDLSGDDELEVAAEIERAAEFVRDKWGLGTGPLPHVVRALERNGIVVARSVNIRREVDAFSVHFEARPLVVLGVDKGVTARSRFDAAHELGHLVLHSDEHANTKQAEQQAHRFASAFLMPRSAIEGELPSQVDFRQLVDLKIRWRVSMAALLRRAKDLRVMTEARYLSAVKAMSARGWRRVEPGDARLGALERPVLVARAVEELEATWMSVEDLCDEAALPADEIRRLLDATSDPRSTVNL